jgi:hypothetical protein
MQAIDESGNRQFLAGKHSLHIGGVSPRSRGEELAGRDTQTRPAITSLIRGHFLEHRRRQ